MVPAALHRLMSDPFFRHSEALTIGYLAGLRGEEPDSDLCQMSHKYEDGWLLGAQDRENGVKPKKFLGYHLESELPFKKGSVVTIPKGTMIRSTSGVKKPAGRTYRITVHHVMNGANLYVEGNGFREDCQPIMAPTVVWVGTGGYWTEADINDIPEAL
jgi:hypothetical protein